MYSRLGSSPQETGSCLKAYVMVLYLFVFFGIIVCLRVGHTRTHTHYPVCSVVSLCHDIIFREAALCGANKNRWGKEAIVC